VRSRGRTIPPCRRSLRGTGTGWRARSTSGSPASSRTRSDRADGPGSGGGAAGAGRCPRIARHRPRVDVPLPDRGGPGHGDRGHDAREVNQPVHKLGRFVLYPSPSRPPVVKLPARHIDPPSINCLFPPVVKLPARHIDPPSINCLFQAVNVPCWYEASRPFRGRLQIDRREGEQLQKAIGLAEISQSRRNLRGCIGTALAELTRPRDNHCANRSQGSPRCDRRRSLCGAREERRFSPAAPAAAASRTSL